MFCLDILPSSPPLHKPVKPKTKQWSDLPSIQNIYNKPGLGNEEGERGQELRSSEDNLEN